MQKRFLPQVATVIVCLFGFVALAAQGGAPPSDKEFDLSRGFLLTGNYVVGGVDLLRSGGTGTISFNGQSGNEVPAGAEVIAAYLMWETIEPQEGQPVTGAMFRDHPIDIAKAARVTAVPGTGASCWGSSGGSNAFLTMYRADVLQALPKHYDAANKWTGRYIVNDADLDAHGLDRHTVTLPQQGTGNRTTTGAGATLLLVFRDESQPLTKVVLYDGVRPQAQGTTTSQTIRGFYRSATDPRARLTYIVGTGADNTRERLVFNGQVIATNPFPAPIDSGSDRGWANPTFDVSALMPGQTNNDGFGEYVVTRVDHGARNQNSTPYECPAFAAIVFSTTVADEDKDGLPDGIEDAPAGLLDPPTPAYPNGEPLPNLHAMGARVGQKDLFVEINAMTAPAGTTYGSPDAPYNSTLTSVTTPQDHDHMPSPTVLKMVGDAYLAGGIRARFDVGEVATYLARFPVCAAGDPKCDASAYLVPSALARGGERIEERACSDCQFKAFPGTVGWPYGLQLYRDAPVKPNGDEMRTLDEIKAGRPDEGPFRRRFDRIRQDYFHYALYAHARGKAKSALPCLDADGTPTEYDGIAAGSCAVGSNPQFNVPSSASGVASLPGGNVLVTLGLWDTEKFVGSEYLQASTTLHEIGHNGNLWHGGKVATFGDKLLNTTTTVEPNCKPNYLSSMSYLFQAHGLLDNSGGLHIGYTAKNHGLLDETALTDSAFTDAAYRPAWFAPFNSPLAIAQNAGAARRYCSGASFDPTAPAPEMARVVAGTNMSVIDWDGDPNTPDAISDVNFDAFGSTLEGHDDWSHFRLDQIRASRTARIFRTANGDLLDFGSGDLLDFGSGDLLDFGSGDLLDFGSGTHMVHFGSGDYFRYGAGDLLDFGSGDLLDFGSGDLLDFGSGVLMIVDAEGDLLDFGSGDLLDFGSGDLLDFGSGDLLDFGSGDLLDFGSGDLLDFGSGDLLDFGSGTGLQELDFELALDLSPPRSTGLSACVLGVDCPVPQPSAGDADYHRVKLTWDAPTFGAVTGYEVYRGTATMDPVLIGTATATTFIDSEELPNGVEFIYFVRPLFSDGSAGANSDTAVKTAIDAAPEAEDDSYATGEGVALSVSAAGVLGNDTDDDSPTLRRVVSTTSPANGTLVMASDGGFTYMPNAGFFGSDSFTYRADNGAWSRDTSIAMSAASNAATVTITVTRANVPPVCTSSATATVITGGSVTLNGGCSDPDGNPLTVTSVGTPSLGSVVLNANGSFTYTAQSPNVGTDTFTYTVSDGVATATGNATITVIYGFANVQNLPPNGNPKFNRGSTVPLFWRWTDISGTALDSGNAGATVQAYACSTSGQLPGAFPTGTFTPELPGSGNSFSFSASSNTWQFNWKLVYTVNGVTYNLPAGTYVLQIKSALTGQSDPGTVHSCANGTTVRGALLQVK